MKFDRTAQPKARSASTSGFNGAWILAATILGSSMAFIDGTVVNVALPALQSSLGATIAQAQWVIEAYMLLLSALLLIGGALGDRYSRRGVFSWGVAIFSAASVLCGLASTIGQLIAGRVLQGIGAALLVPGSLALITASFPEEERGRAIGTWSGFTAITAAIGPVLGGWFIEHASWRWVFYINPPIGLLVIALLLRRTPEQHDSDDSARLDWPGAALATVGLGGIVYGLLESSLWIGLLGTVGLVLFFILEARAKNPMLPLTLFRSRAFAGANLLTFFLYGALGGALFFFPLNLIQVQGYSATLAGAALLPFVLLMFFLSRTAGAIGERYGTQRPLVVGSLLVAGAFALFARPGIGGSYWTTFFPPVLLLGLGMATAVAPLTNTVMSSVEESHAGIASGVNNAVSRVAGLVAVAIFGLVVTGIFDRELDRKLADLPRQTRAGIEARREQVAAIETPDPRARAAVRESFVAGYRVAMLMAAALGIASALSAATLLGGKKKESP